MTTYKELLNDSATPVMVRRIIALLTDEKGHSRYDPVDVLNNLEVLVLAAKAELRVDLSDDEARFRHLAYLRDPALADLLLRVDGKGNIRVERTQRWTNEGRYGRGNICWRRDSSDRDLEVLMLARTLWTKTVRLMGSRSLDE